MKYDELITGLQETNWFSCLGNPISDDGLTCIPDLNFWGAENSTNPDADVLLESMEWLPTSQHQEDPIHQDSLKQNAQEQGKGQEFSILSLEACQKTRTGLRSFTGHRLLKVGPHDFTLAAEQAAVYATRMAAYEILTERVGFWCRTIELYQRGHWPLGYLPDHRIVVL